MKEMWSSGGTSTALVTLLAPIAWGSTYVTITQLLPPDRPVLVAAARVAPAGIVLAGLGWLRGRWMPRGSQWGHLALSALFNFGLFFPLLIVGIYRLPGGVAASMGGVQPLLVGVVTWIVTRRAMRGLDIGIGVVAAIGVAMVVIRPGADVDMIGVIAALGANVSFSIGVVATKHLPTPDDRLAATGWQLLLATAIIGPVAIVVEGTPPAMSGTNVVGFAYLSLIATGAAFAIWFNGIRSLPTQAPPVLGLAAPLTGATLGWMLLGEDLTTIQMLGFAVTITAITYAATLGTRSSDRMSGHRPIVDGPPPGGITKRVVGSSSAR